MAYDDPPDVIELGEVEPATGQPATNTGMFRSRSLLLVPDDTDDDHPVDGVTDGLRNDRTHIVALGGEVIVSYSTRTVRARVPVRRQLPVHVTVLTDADNQPLIGEKFVDQARGGTSNSRYDAGEPFRDGNGAYTPRLSQAGATLRVNEDLGYANEIYGQAGIRVRLVALQFRVAPAALASGRIVLSPTVDPRTNERRPIVGDQNLTATEKALLRTERARPQDGFNSPDPNDIEVYFLPLIELGDFPAAGGLPAITSSGVAFSELPRDPRGGYKGMRTPDVNDSLVVSDKSSFEVLAHEMLHIVGEPHHDQRPNLMFANAFAKVDRDQFAVTDSKRITLLQGVAARSSAYTLGP